MLPRRPPVRLSSYALTFAVLAAFLVLTHAPLLKLPFYWDEAGQFIPASLDLFRLHAWIPVSTVPNTHPPGLMAFLTGVWSIFGFSIEATRLAMLLVAASGALCTFLLAIELSRGAPGAPAFTALVLLLISPLFFAQSMLAQLDLPAMVLSVLALLLYLQDRFPASAIACAVLVLAKETGLIVPALFGAWLIYERRIRAALWFLLPLPGLAVWFVALHHATGHWFGNPQFAAYNLGLALHPLDVAGAFLRRVYFLFVSSGYFIGTAVLLWAWKRMPLFRERPWRIAAAFVAVHILFFSFLGGAVLERYLLPALPVVLTAFAVAFRSLLPRTRLRTLAVLVVCLAAANFINPPYPFPYENNLAFVDFVRLEQNVTAAIDFLPAGPIAAAFPVSDALRRPDLGFVTVPRKVTEVSDFTQAGIDGLKSNPPSVLIVSPGLWDPLHLLDREMVRNLLTSYFGYQPRLTADEIAHELSMRVTRRFRHRGMSMELLERL